MGLQLDGCALLRAIRRLSNVASFTGKLKVVLEKNATFHPAGE